MFITVLTFVVVGIFVSTAVYLFWKDRREDMGWQLFRNEREKYDYLYEKFVSLEEINEELERRCAALEEERKNVSK